MELDALEWLFLDEEATRVTCFRNHLLCFRYGRLKMKTHHTFSAAAFLPAMRPPTMQRARPCSLNPPADSPAQ